MAAPKSKVTTEERLWEPLDRPGVRLTEAEVEAEEDEHDRLLMEDYHRRKAAGELETISLEEAVARGWFSEDEARRLR